MDSPLLRIIGSKRDAAEDYTETGDLMSEIMDVLNAKESSLTSTGLPDGAVPPPEPSLGLENGYEEREGEASPENEGEVETSSARVSHELKSELSSSSIGPPIQVVPMEWREMYQEGLGLELSNVNEEGPTAEEPPTGWCVGPCRQSCSFICHVFCTVQLVKACLIRRRGKKRKKMMRVILK